MPNDQIAKINKINAIAGNPSNQGWEAIHHQLKICASEFAELTDAIEAHDVNELRDGIADVLFTIFGLAHRAGLDAERDLDVVILSNLSKFDRTETDALLTKAKYDALGVPTDVRTHDANGTIYYITVVDADCVGTDGKTYPKGKYLKSHLWLEPWFTPLPEPVASQLEERGVADA